MQVRPNITPLLIWTALEGFQLAQLWLPNKNWRIHQGLGLVSTERKPERYIIRGGNLLDPSWGTVNCIDGGKRFLFSTQMCALVQHPPEATADHLFCSKNSFIDCSNLENSFGSFDHIVAVSRRISTFVIYLLSFFSLKTVFAAFKCQVSLFCMVLNDKKRASKLKNILKNPLLVYLRLHWSLHFSCRLMITNDCLTSTQMNTDNPA